MVVCEHIRIMNGTTTATIVRNNFLSAEFKHEFLGHTLDYILLFSTLNHRCKRESVPSQPNSLVAGSHTTNKLKIQRN